MEQNICLKTLVRQYTASSYGDMENISNKRCPEYALSWTKEFNDRHWEKDHDYFLGNGLNINDNLELRQILSEKLARGTLHNKIIFCDLDGVLADFEEGVKRRFKKSPDELAPNMMWGVINKSNTFFETLPWTPKGRELWEEIKQYDPIILTGIPKVKTAAEQKRKWCARELGEDIHVITCLTKEKPKYCITDSILIDDRPDNLNEWNRNFGKFILYDEDYQEKIIQKIHKYANKPVICSSPNSPN
jgi:hypothetical protein